MVHFYHSFLCLCTVPKDNYRRMKFNSSIRLETRKITHSTCFPSNWRRSHSVNETPACRIVSWEDPPKHDITSLVIFKFAHKHQTTIRKSNYTRLTPRCNISFECTIILYRLPASSEIIPSGTSRWTFPSISNLQLEQITTIYKARNDQSLVLESHKSPSFTTPFSTPSTEMQRLPYFAPTDIPISQNSDPK